MKYWGVYDFSRLVIPHLRIDRVKRKIGAANEARHKILGTIDAREEFDAQVALIQSRVSKRG